MEWSKLEALADDIINVTQKLKFVSVRVENIVKEKMLITSIFSFFLNVFKGPLS